DGGAALGVAERRDDAARFVQDQVAGRLRDQAAAVDLDGVLVHVGLGAELGDDAPVHADAAGEDDLLAGAAGRDARLGNDFLKTLLHGGARLPARAHGGRT